MSYTATPRRIMREKKLLSGLRGLGQNQTAQDVATGVTAGSTAIANLITAIAGATRPQTPAMMPGIDPTTGLPYGTTTTPYTTTTAIDPSTGLPYAYGAQPATDYTIPFVVGGLAIAGVVGFLVLRNKKSASTTPNRRRRSRRNSRRRIRRSHR